MSWSTGVFVHIGCKRNQQAQRVAITLLRVAREIAFYDEGLEQETPNAGAQPYVSCVFISPSWHRVLQEPKARFHRQVGRQQIIGPLWTKPEESPS